MEAPLKDTALAPSPASASAATVATHAPPQSPLNPKVFGPWLWTLLHALAFAYTPSHATEEAILDASSAIDVVEGIGFLMVCAKCHAHLQKDLATHPVAKHVFERKTYAQWTVDVHNRVNKRLDKPQLSFADAEKRFGSTCACSRTPHAAAPATDLELQDLAAYWKALLALAFGFPSEPSRAQQVAARSFLKAVLRLFPCSACRPALRAYATTMPTAPILSSQEFVDEVRQAFSVVQNRTLGNGLSLSMEEMVAEFDGAGCGDCSIDALLKAISEQQKQEQQQAPSSPSTLASSAAKAAPLSTATTIATATSTSAPARAHTQTQTPAETQTSAQSQTPTRADADRAAALLAAREAQAYFFRILAICGSITALLILLWLFIQTFRKPQTPPSEAEGSASEANSRNSRPSSGALAGGARGRPYPPPSLRPPTSASMYYEDTAFQAHSPRRGYGQN